MSSGLKWAGLTQNSPPIACVNETCDGLMTWADGTDFAFDPAMNMDVTGTGQSGNCLVYDAAGGSTQMVITPEVCSMSPHNFICQFNCTVREYQRLLAGREFKIVYRS